MKLYDLDISGNCYKVRLLCALLGMVYEVETVNTLKGESKTEDFLKLNPRGQIPVLEDGGEILWDSIAILVYLARKQQSEWLPTEPLAMARVMQWLAFSEDELHSGLAVARRVKKLGVAGDFEQAKALSLSGLAILQQQLEGQKWLVGDAPTIADIACYPYVALAHEGEIEVSAYPAVSRWMASIESLPGYISMPGIRLSA